MTSVAIRRLRDEARELTPLERVILREDFLFEELDALYERIKAVQAEKARLMKQEERRRQRELRQARKYLGESVQEVA